MAWRDQLIDAALDRVPFLYETVGGEIGRRNVNYEFPDRDTPFIDDLGRRMRKWTIDAYVLGPDYLIGKDALAAVIETKGAHTFSHPYSGDKQVKVDGPVAVTETTREGGMARFRIAFVEAGEEEELLRIPDTANRVGNAADRVIDELGKSTRFSVLDAIQDVIDAAIAGVQNASSALRRARGKVAARMNTIESLSQAIDDFENELDLLINSPQQMMNQFAGLVGSVMNLINTASGLGDTAPTNTIPLDFDRPDVARNTFRDLDGFEVEAEPPPDTTPQRVQEQTNQDATVQMMRTSAVAETSRAMVDLDLESADQAIAIRDELGETFEALLESEETEDPLYEALEDLRTEISNHLQTVAQTLPVVSEYTPPVTIPALVIAYSLYTDAGQDLDIVARNRIPHPGFVSGSVPLEVLSNAE